MVFLTMTPSIVEALETIQSLQNSAGTSRTEAAINCAEPVPLQDQVGTTNELNDKNAQRQASTDEDEGHNLLANESGAVEDIKGKSEELSLSNPKVGNPIAHGQILDLSRQLKHHSLSPPSLDLLLRGSKVYVPPPQPKPEPTSEYKALMARLRRDEELRAYDRMINPLPPMQSFSQQFPASSAANAFVSNHQQQDDEDDEVTYADINRQMTLILNVLVTIVACGAAIWMIARWWPTPARLAISMIGSLVIGIAEVVVYGGYLRRVGEAKDKAKDLKEVKEVVKTWVVGGGGENPETDIQDEPVMIEDKADLSNAKRRKRKEADPA